MTFVSYPWIADRKAALGLAALALTILTVLCLFSVSSALLDNVGYHYYVPGGMPWEKIHPATLLAAGALVLRIAASSHPRRTAERLFGDTPVVLYIVSIVIAAAHAALVSATPVTQLVDTLVLPILLFCLLKDLDPEMQAWLAYVIGALLAVNALIAFVEVPTGWRLVPTYLPDTNSMGLKSADGSPILTSTVDWRGTALLGHPLLNALTVGAATICFASAGARWMHPAVRYPLIALLVLSQAAFGGRASLVLATAGLLVIGTLRTAEFIRRGCRVPRRTVGLCFLILPFVVAAVAFAFEAGAFDRFVDRFVNDNGSAQTRILMWQMFDPLPWSQILLGPDPDVTGLTQYLLGIELGIESFWVSMTLAYGLIVAAVLFCGIAFFAGRIIVEKGTGAAGVLLYFFLVASTSTSLSSKSTSFALTTAMIMTVLPARLLRTQESIRVRS